VGWSFGSPVGIPFIEVHGGLSYTWILSRSHDGIPPSDYGYDNYQKILDGPRRSWDNVPYEQRGGVPWDAP
jgi:hypothetical protein